MTQENKELLLKDLSARLPYGVKIKVRSNDIRTVRMVDMVEGIVHFAESDSISPFGVHIEHPLTFRQVIKPYLRPMSSMTKEETKELFKEIGFEFTCNTCGIPAHYNYEFAKQIKGIPTITNVEFIKVIDWLNKKMFDYRGLIERGLAIAVTEENNPYKE